MNEIIAVLRVFLWLLCSLAAWIWVWKAVVTRRIAHGKNRFIAHLLGVMIGIGAAFGASCLIGAFLLSGVSDESSIAVDIGGRLALGIGGALVLLVYLRALHPSASFPRKSFKELLQENNRKQEEWLRHKEEKRAQRREERRGQQELLRQKKENKQKELLRYKEEKRRQKELLQQQQEKQCAALGKALGMSFGDFFEKRMESHMKFWGIVLLIIAWIAVFIVCDWPPEEGGWFTRLAVSFIFTGLTAVFLCLLIAPIYMALLLLLPFACVSIFIEARWRIRHNAPYVALPIGYNYIASSTPRQSSSSGDWLVPLAIGWWIGRHK